MKKDLGLKEKAFLSRGGSLREKASFLLGRTTQPLEKPEEALLRKSHHLETVLEISQEIYRTLDPVELMNILLLTFMGQFRSSRGGFFLRDQESPIEISKGIDREDIQTLNLEEVQEIKDFRNREGKVDFAFPVMGKSELLGHILLGNTGLEDVEKEKSVFGPLLSLGGIALENALLYDQIQSKFEQLKALHEIGEILNQTPNLEEVLFLAFSTLEHGLGINKMFLLLKNEQGAMSVFDGNGCREKSHRSLKIESGSEIAQYLDGENAVDLMDRGIRWNRWLAEEDAEEMNLAFFVPLKVYGELFGYMAIFEVEKLRDMDWYKKLYQLVGSHFANAVYMLRHKGTETEKGLDLKDTLKAIIEEQLNFTKKMDMELGFALIQPGADAAALHEFVKEHKMQAINLFFNHKILLVPGEDTDSIEILFQQGARNNYYQLISFTTGSAADSAEKVMEEIKIY
jgi:hypothetical protein